MVKTELRYSIIHEVVLDRGDVGRAFYLEEYKKLENKSKRFQELYKKNIKRIISLIEKEIGHKKWRYNFIPIYVVDIDLKKCEIKEGGKMVYWKGYGDPITILIRHEKLMLFTLIHELCHNLLSLEQHAKMGYRKAEDYIHKEVSQAVWNKLSLGDWRKYIKK